jgi:hypothetical protein
MSVLFVLWNLHLHIPPLDLQREGNQVGEEGVLTANDSVVVDPEAPRLW